MGGRARARQASTKSGLRPTIFEATTSLNSRPRPTSIATMTAAAAAVETALPGPSTDKHKNDDAVMLHEIAIDGGAKRPIEEEKGDKAHLGIRILKGKSVVTVSGLLTQSETQQLQQSVIQAAAHETVPTADSDIGRSCIRMPTQTAAARQDIPDAGTQDLHDPLPVELSEAVETTILKRTMAYLDDNLPEVVQTLFGYDVKLLQLFWDNELEWSSREPAINVYYQGGHFGVHKDNKALTILMPLSSPNDDFQGGGTAFWHQLHPNETRHAPSLTLTPPAGTALLFGGKVSHKGLSVTEGTRVVFVASFSRKASQKAAKTWTVAAR